MVIVSQSQALPPIILMVPDICGRLELKSVLCFCHIKCGFAWNCLWNELRVETTNAIEHHDPNIAARKPPLSEPPKVARCRDQSQIIGVVTDG